MKPLCEGGVIIRKTSHEENHSVVDDAVSHCRDYYGANLWRREF